MTLAGGPAQGDLSGAILSRKYALKRLLGTGGMGAVYESQSPDDGRPIAIKVLSVEHLADAEIKARFLDEGAVCQRLIHPNIVRVFDVAEAEDGTPYIVMEYLDGVPLSAYTRSGVRVPVQQAATILQGILAGLSAAHAQGIVHRDLKPENVVLAREPNGAFTAKVLDFGIAKVMDAAGGMGHKTRTGVLLGTPAYMSPEQIKSAKDVDARTDLWSAGVMFYEMLAGRVAFPAPTEYARLAAVLNNTPTPLESIDSHLVRLSPFVQLALQKDRARRFQSGLEMARALATAMGTVGAAPAAATPLSRLPDVPSVWMPTKMSSSAPASGSAPDTPGVGPGGTLTSPAGPQHVVDAPVHIAIVGASAGTLPSENLPMFSADGASMDARASRRGVAPWIVILLVIGALVAGFLFGFATARVFR